ncbi:MAG: hypothetical protein Q9219_001686 [cf. Caloplaca sp. 3 TL-2023]
MTSPGARPLIPDPQAFSTLSTAALANNVTFWNGGELYGTPSANSLHLLARYAATARPLLPPPPESASP